MSQAGFNFGIEFDLAEFNRTLKKYAETTGKTLNEALRKKADSFSGYWYRGELLKLKPAKGSIKSMMFQLLAHSGGIQVRPGLRDRIAGRYQMQTDLGTRKNILVSTTGKKSKKERRAGTVIVKGKKLNLQALAVRAEIALRSRGAGWTAYAAQLRDEFRQLSGEGVRTHKGRYKQEMALLSINRDSEGTASVIMNYGSSPRSEVGESLNQPRAIGALQRAIQASTADMNAYMAKRVADDIAKANAA